MALGNRIAEQGGQGETRLYSPYPFPWRQETGGLRDEFAREAWEFFTQHANKPFFRFAEFNRGPALRYATADIMRSSCVNCHNTHPDTPKSDWKDGDVRGVLEVVLPLGDAIAQTRTGLRGTWILFGTLTVLGLAGLAFLVVRRS